MKLYKFILPLCLGGTLMLQSCEDFLNSEPTEIYSDDIIWENATNADAFVLNAYGNILSLYTDFEGMEKGLHPTSVLTRSSCPGFLRGLGTREDDWGFNKDQYTRIRKANLIIQNAASATALSEADKTRFVAEGKMLRAMVYYNMARRFGRFMWVDRPLGADDVYELPLTASIEESYNKILADVNDAIAGLPDNPGKARLSKDAARAFKSEVCLTAVAYTGKTALLQEAIDAVDQMSTASLDEDYEGMFKASGAKTSPEIILAQYSSNETTTVQGTDMINLVPNVVNSQMETGYGPAWKKADVFEGWMEYTPSQNLVDNYLVIDETTKKAVRWNESSQFTNNTKVLAKDEILAKISPRDDKEVTETTLGYEVKNKDGRTISDLMYSGRDKRFEASIVYDGATYYSEDIHTHQMGNMNRGVKKNYGADHSPISNYLWRKGVYDVSPRAFYNVYTDYHKIVFRYGHALLNKAEALLCQAKTDPSKLALAVTALNLTREKHGELPGSTAATLAEAWKDYKTERTVEMAKEADLYWSLLRWGKFGGDANDGNAAGGMIDELNCPATFPEISQDRTAVYIGNVQFENDKRQFVTARGYLFPIPKNQIDANSALSDKDQNPGW